MWRSSERTAGATFLDREARIGAIRSAAERLRSRHTEVRRVVLFGSLARGLAGPRSDADLLIEVTSSTHQQIRDRSSEILEALRPLPCPVDLIVVTSEEMLSRAASFGVVREALLYGIDLLGPMSPSR